MANVKTSELLGTALDWAVATCEGEVTELGFDGIVWGFRLNGHLKVLAKGWAASMNYHPSSNWSQGGPIIERERLEIIPLSTGEWGATSPKIGAVGSTPLIAAMRCYVASKLGDTVEIPNELL